jgi:multidrug efflux pump subunit AcrA (membrane-fusion protein)
VDVPLRTRPKRRKLAIALFVSSACLLMLLAALERARGAGLPAVARSSLWTARVKHAELVRDVPVQGTLVPESVQWLSAESGGRVARIALRPGASVEPDTIVLALENPELELAALEAERLASSARAELIALDTRTESESRGQEALVAALDAERDDADRRSHAAHELAAAGLVSALERSGQETKAKGLGERLDAETARLRVLARGRDRQLAARREELRRLRDIAAFRRRQVAALGVRAGVRGTVQEISVESGMWIQAGSVLAKIARTSALEARLKVSEGNADAVRPGLGVRFEEPFGTLRGHVERVHPAVSGGSVELDVALDVSLPAGARADQAVTCYVELERSGHVVLVTRPARAREHSSSVVFRVEPGGGQASPKTVRFGKGSLREIVVLSGLLPGDEIVVSDTSDWDAKSSVRLE